MIEFGLLQMQKRKSDIIFSLNGILKVNICNSSEMIFYFYGVEVFCVFVMLHEHRMEQMRIESKYTLTAIIAI